MTPPWFLELLALPATADERDIKRAYARRLKDIDQAADPEGFARLRQAYELARAHLEHPVPVDAPAARPTPAPRSEERPRPSIPPEHERFRRPATTDDAHVPPAAGSTHGGSPSFAEPRSSGSPGDAARRLLDGFMARVHADDAHVTRELNACLDQLRRVHMDASTVFELMLIEELRGETMHSRDTVYRIARDLFAWTDILHAQRLDQLGDWILTVERQRHQLEQSKGGPTLLRLLAPVARGGPLPEKLLAHWPSVDYAAKRFTQVMVLYLTPTVYREWARRYGSLSKSKKRKVERLSFAPVPRPGSFAAYVAFTWRLVKWTLLGLFVLTVIAICVALVLDPPGQRIPDTTASLARRAAACRAVDAQLRASGRIPAEDERRQLDACHRSGFLPAPVGPTPR